MAAWCTRRKNGGRRLLTDRSDFGRRRTSHRPLRFRKLRARLCPGPAKCDTRMLRVARRWSRVLGCMAAAPVAVAVGARQRRANARRARLAKYARALANEPRAPAPGNFAPRRPAIKRGAWLHGCVCMRRKYGGRRTFGRPVRFRKVASRTGLYSYVQVRPCATRVYYARARGARAASPGSL